MINRGEFVKWSWVTPVGINLAYKIEQTETPSSKTSSGFSSGTPIPTGTFTYQFNQKGIFYYWSGIVETNAKIELRGVIEVKDPRDVDLPINVTLDGIQGF